MLKTRIIPTLLWKDLNLVKGRQFHSWRQVGSLLPAIRVYNLRQVDELVFLDIAASLNQRGPDYELIADFSAECSVPLTVGGGVTSLDHIRRLLNAGADKVAINSLAFTNLEIVAEACHHFGSQCIVASIDAKRQFGEYSVYSHSGTRDQKQEVCSWAKKLLQAGVGEIMLTSIDRDGCMNGYDLSLIQSVANVIDVPLIVSGGAGKPEDFLHALRNGASALAAASLFHFTEFTPNDIKEYLSQQGIAVRQC